MFVLLNACVAALLLAKTDAHELVTSGNLRGNDGKEPIKQQEVVVEDNSHYDEANTRSMIPMTKEKLLLVEHAITRNRQIYNHAEVPEGVTEHIFHNRVDKMFTEEQGNYCVVTWMGTDPNPEDWIQNFSPVPKRVGDNNCVVHQGFWRAYSGSGSGNSELFIPELTDFIESCSTARKQLVFTGHSQGGGAAGVAHTQWADQNPIAILFGSAPWILDSRESCRVNPDTVWRFMNSENTLAGQIVYDIVPALVGIHLPFLKTSGGCIILPPGNQEGSMSPDTDQVAYYPPGHSELRLVNDWNIDFTGRAHFNYRIKINALVNKVPDGSELNTNGFVDNSSCNDDDECDSGHCLLSLGMKCSPKLDDGEQCAQSTDCVSGRCDFESWEITAVARCFPKLGAGEACNEDSDCVSGRCRNSRWRWWQFNCVN